VYAETPPRALKHWPCDADGPSGCAGMIASGEFRVLKLLHLGV